MSKEEVYSSIRKAMRRYHRTDKLQEQHQQEIRTLLSYLSTGEANNLIYSIFAPYYDNVMRAHERAILKLLRQIITVEGIGFRSPNEIVQDDILEMSCGTGTVIERLCEALPQKRAKQLRVTANDVSEDMKQLARIKLRKLPCRIEYSDQDIPAMKFGKQFRTVFLSQTCHLICDDDVVRQERADNYMHIDEHVMRHRYAKHVAMSNAYDHIAPNGTFVIIDEWPALISDRALGPEFAYLFKNSLRALDWRDIRAKIMDKLPYSRFVAQLKVPIDARHVMYLIVYRKDPTKTATRLPFHSEYGDARRKAVDAVVNSFNAINKAQRDSIRPPAGSAWVKFLPFDRSPSFYDEEMPTGRRNSIIISNRLHITEPNERLRMLERAIGMLEIGGTLLVIDEWPPPGTETANAISKTTFVETYMDRFSRHMVDAGSIRVPILPPHSSGMYGYQYKRVL